MNLNMYCAKTLCNLFDCVSILPDFKSFVKALNFYKIQGGFTTIFAVLEFFKDFFLLLRKSRRQFILVFAYQLYKLKTLETRFMYLSCGPILP